MDISAQKHVRSRITHRKSRLGCVNCKRRRIKCDEKRPICSHCANHGIECVFTSGAPPITDTSNNSQPLPRRFRPYQHSSGGLEQTFKLSKPSDQFQPSKHHQHQEAESLTPIAIPTQSNPQPDLSTNTITLPDLQLFHNYTISTYQTMRDNDQDPHNIWQSHLVRWGFQFPSILHLILALSALHMGHKSPSLRQHYFQQADDHFTFGIRSVTGVLSQLNAENCQKVYMSAVMICFIYFGRGPRPGEYLVFSDSGPAEWLVLMRGVKLIVRSHHDKVFSGLLEPKGEHVEYTITPEMCMELHEFTIHIEAVRRLIDQEIINEEERILHVSAIDDLLGIAREIYERASSGREGVALMDVLIGWLYRRPEAMVGFLEQKASCALVILAYWGVLFTYMDSAWFMEGWAEHVLSGISRSLHLGFRPWIAWPLLKVYRVYDAIK